MQFQGKIWIYEVQVDLVPPLNIYATNYSKESCISNKTDFYLINFTKQTLTLNINIFCEVMRRVWAVVDFTCTRLIALELKYIYKIIINILMI